MELGGGDIRDSAIDFLAFALRLRKTPENLRKPLGHIVAQPVIASNGVPFLQMKSVGSGFLLHELNLFRSGQKSMPKKLRSRI